MKSYKIYHDKNLWENASRQKPVFRNPARTNERTNEPTNQPTNQPNNEPTNENEEFIPAGKNG